MNEFCFAPDVVHTRALSLFRFLFLLSTVLIFEKAELFAVVLFTGPVAAVSPGDMSNLSAWTESMWLSCCQGPQSSLPEIFGPKAHGVLLPSARIPATFRSKATSTSCFVFSYSSLATCSPSLTSMRLLEFLLRKFWN